MGKPAATEGARRGRPELPLGRSAAKEHTMSADSNDDKKKRRFLSPEKKYQIFLETQHSDVPVAEILGREGPLCHRIGPYPAKGEGSCP